LEEVSNDLLDSALVADGVAVGSIPRAHLGDI
jgi:hypothetical protein